MQAKRAQALIISVWVLVALAVIALSLGHRVSMMLRIAAFHRDDIKALYAAKAGAWFAGTQLIQDTNDYDAHDEDWANNEELFKKITLDDADYAFATVSYQDEEGQTRYGMTDEESRINLNTASKEILASLFSSCDIEQTRAQELARDILYWRGSEAAPPAVSAYYETSLHYKIKQKKFARIEELMLVKGTQDLDKDTLADVLPLLTIYGDGKININTASSQALLAVALSTGGANQNDAQAVVNAILATRTSAPFTSLENLATTLNLPNPSGAYSLAQAVSGFFTTQSQFFRIEVTGNARRVVKDIIAVYSRADKKIVTWQEN